MPVNNLTSEKRWAQWCKNQWAMIKLGGVWIVPRSGLVFTKTETGFNLSDLMPDGKAPFDTAYQAEDFRDIQRHFAAASLQVTDTKNLLALETHNKNEN